MFEVQIPYIRLDNQRTKPKNRRTETRYIIAYVLDFRQTEIYNTTVKEPFLGNLPQALVGDDKQTKIPPQPVVKEQEQAQDKTGTGVPKVIGVVGPDKNWDRTNQKRDSEQIKALAHLNYVMAKNKQHLLVVMLTFKLFGHGSIIIGHFAVRKHGAPGRIRTYDTFLRTEVLYPLSYRGIEAAALASRSD